MGFLRLALVIVAIVCVIGNLYTLAFMALGVLVVLGAFIEEDLRNELTECHNFVQALLREGDEE